MKFTVAWITNEKAIEELLRGSLNDKLLTHENNFPKLSHDQARQKLEVAEGW